MDANISSAYSVQSTIFSGWAIALIVFVITLVALWLLSTNFRRFFAGGVILGGLSIITLISKWIGFTAAEGDTLPLEWFAWIAGFIIASTTLGYYIGKWAGRTDNKKSLIKRYAKEFEVEVSK